jgi:hypothetical protein
MATEAELARYVDDLTTILWNYGATLSAPFVLPAPNGHRSFAIRAVLPGPAEPEAPEIVLREVWRATGDDRFELAGYGYEFIERPLNRRRAFHRHDDATFMEQYSSVVHEHCEERLGHPTCEHYYGLPMDAYEAIRAFTVLWGQPGPIGCDDFRCMS